jgi:hypothetical protein
MPIEEADTLGALLELYKEQCTHGRHIESQRQEITAILFTLAAALITLMGVLNFTFYSFPIGFLLFLVGALGWRFMQRYVEKWNETDKRRTFYRKKIESLALISCTGVTNSPGRLRTLWKLIFAAIMVIGVFCTAFVFVLSWWHPLPIVNSSIHRISKLVTN